MSNHTVVVRPESTEDVAKVVKIAVKYKMPVTPYSGGSSLEGNFRAVYATPISVPRNCLTILYSTRPVGFAQICPEWTRFSRFTV